MQRKEKQCSGSELDEVADCLCNVLNDMENIMKKLDKLELLSNEEKQSFERLFARLNGFVLGLDYIKRF